jgi:hypothetical protein
MRVVVTKVEAKAMVEGKVVVLALCATTTSTSSTSVLYFGRKLTKVRLARGKKVLCQSDKIILIVVGSLAGELLRLLSPAGMGFTHRLDSRCFYLACRPWMLVFKKKSQ